MALSAGGESPTATRRAVLRLASVEVWERYSFYCMFTLLPLFLSGAAARGGLGLEVPAALRLFGTYVAAVQILPLAGGWLLDRWRNAGHALAVGGTAMLAGHTLLGLMNLPPLRAAGGGPSRPALIAGLALIALGNGVFKPGISAAVARLPHADAGAREAGFLTLYVCISLGSLSATILGGALAEWFGWDLAFGSAAAGMAVALALVARVRALLTRSPTAPAAVAIAAGRAARPPAAAALALLIALATAFFVGSYQVAGLSNVLAEQRVDRHLLGVSIPATWFLALNPVGVLVLTPPLARWAARPESRFARATPAVKLAVAFVCAALACALLAGAVAASAGGRLAGPGWIAGAVLALTVGELLIAPIGLATLTRLAPADRQGLAIGLWFAANGASGYLSGQLGALAAERGAGVLVAMTALFAALAGLLAVAAPRLRRAGF